MAQHFQPRHRIAGAANLLGNRHIGHAIEEDEADPAHGGAEGENGRKLPRVRRCAEGQAGGEHGEEAGKVGHGGVTGEVLAAQRFGHQLGDPRQPRATGNAPHEVEAEQQHQHQREQGGSLRNPAVSGTSAMPKMNMTRVPQPASTKRL